MDIALLVLRVVVGAYLFGHGAQKLFGWFGGHGQAGTAGFMSMLGFRPARFWALNAGLAEAAGGLLLAIGLLSPLGSLGVIAAMLVATFSVHLGKGAFGSTGGPELPLTNVAVAVAVAVAGPGRYSLDSLLGVALPEPALGIVLAVLTLLGVGAAFLTRRTAPQPEPAGSRAST